MARRQLERGLRRPSDGAPRTGAPRSLRAPDLALSAQPFCFKARYWALSRVSSFGRDSLAIWATFCLPSATWASRSCMTLSASTVAQPGTGGVNWLTAAALK